MKVRNWYTNGELAAFCKFCRQNKGRLISVQLKDSKIVKGILCDHRFEPFDVAGVFILLTNSANHQAFYALSDIDSLHYLASASLIQKSSVVPSKLVISSNGLTYLH